MKKDLFKKTVACLSDNERKALKELKERINEKYPETELILYGSKARGDYHKYSDLDVLVLINGNIGKEIEEYYVDLYDGEQIKVIGVVNGIKKEIRDIAYDIELDYDVVIGLIIEYDYYWNNGPITHWPFHENVDKDGISL